jgi:hypothetical protein
MQVTGVTPQLLLGVTNNSGGSGLFPRTQFFRQHGHECVCAWHRIREISVPIDHPFNGDVSPYHRMPRAA